MLIAVSMPLTMPHWVWKGSTIEWSILDAGSSTVSVRLPGERAGKHSAPKLNAGQLPECASVLRCGDEDAKPHCRGKRTGCRSAPPGEVRINQARVWPRRPDARLPQPMALLSQAVQPL